MYPKRVSLFLSVAALASMLACGTSPQVRTQQALDRGRKLYEAKDYARAVLEFKNAAQASPKDAEAQYQLGRALLASGDIREAYAALRRATELNPAHAAAQIKVSELLTASNNPSLLKDAAERLESVLSSRPGDSDALAALAFTEMRLGDTKEAEEHLAQALEAGPANLKAAVGLASVRLSQRDVAAAEGILRRAAEEQKPPAATAHLILGQFYMGTKREADARREFQRALEIEKGNASALLYLGYLHARAGQTGEAEAVYKRVSALPDKQYRAVHAVYLFQNGRRDEAVKELEALVAADPSDRPTRRRLVSSYLSMGKSSEAERILVMALKKNAKDVDALLHRSAILMSVGKFDEAYSNLTQVVNFEPNSAEAHYLMGRVHAARGNSKSRRAELSEALRLNPEMLAARVEYARSLISSDARIAQKVLDEAPEWQKRSASFVAERNWVLAALGRKSDMRKQVDEALKTLRSPDLMLQDALLKLDDGNLAAGRSVLEEILKQAPNDIRALEVLAQSYAAQGQPAAAVKRVREYASLHPASARAQHQLGVWLQRTGSVAEARTAFQAAKAADASFWLADVALASLEIAGKNLDSARALLQPLVAHPQAGLQARALLAMAEQGTNPTAGIEHYRRILELQPDNVLALNNLAYNLCEYANSPDEALKFAERAKELAPDNPTIDDTLGWILYRKGLHSRALQYLESSVKKQPNAARHAHLAMAYAAQGDSKRGFDQLEAAIRLGGASVPEVQAAQRALAGVR